VGTDAFISPQNGKLLIETHSKEETEALEKDINAKCGGELEANIHKLRKPRLVIFSIPEDIYTTNLEDTLMAKPLTLT
jgi:hypothetical protein